MDEREQFIEAWLKQDTDFASLCRAFGVSRKTGYKWTKRFRDEGREGLRPRAPIPGPHPDATPIDVVIRVLAARKAHPNWGPRKIRAHLLDRMFAWDPPAASTIGSILARHNLVRPRRRRRHVDPATNPFSACERPNDTWCADFKGHFKLGNGARCHPLTISDAHSRMLLRCEGLPQPTGANTLPVFEAAFTEYGLPRAIRTDNGPPFATLGAGGLSRLAVWWIKLGICPERIEPGRPQQNGRHERMHRTLKQETTRPPELNLARQQLAFDEFRREYNHQRPHEALGQRPPASVYQPSERSFPTPLRPPEYAPDVEVRRVDHNGTMKWRGHRFFLSEALAHEHVGFLEVEGGKYDVRYGSVLLGVLDDRGKEPTFVRPMKCHPRSRSEV